jgi:hypothetical protein
MPKTTERERLAKLEADQSRLALEADRVRKNVRAGYGALIVDLAVESLSEREFRELVAQAIRKRPIATAVPGPWSGRRVRDHRRSHRETGARFWW